jgi:hypothetical protein
MKLPPVELRDGERLGFEITGELVRVESIHQPKGGRGTWVTTTASKAAIEADPIVMAKLIRSGLDASEENIRNGEKEAA